MRPLEARASWSSPHTVNRLYRLTEESFSEKIVHQGKDGKLHTFYVEQKTTTPWIEGRLRPGDIILCHALRGDGYYDYNLVQHTKMECGKLHLVMTAAAFSAYAFAAESLPDLSNEQYVELMGGRPIQLSL